MVARIDNGIGGVTVQSVDTLYQEYERMDVPAYYHEGGENPYAGRCRIIPRRASHYMLIPAGDDANVAMGRAVMKGIARRRKVREVLCSKHEINYNMFANAGKIMVLYV